MNNYKAIFIITIITACVTNILGKGSVALDEISFSKVINRFPGVLVKFDVAFPYGDKQEIFEKLAEETSKNNELLIAQVGIKDYGEKENEIFTSVYEIHKKDFPVVKLFLQNTDNPISFPATTEFTVENLKTFIRDNSNIYIGLPGCLQQFDELAKEYVNSDDNEKQLYLKMAKKLHENSNKDEESSSKVYITFMKKIFEEGKSFIKKETQRLTNILEGKLSKKKKTEMEERLNILKAFAFPLKDEL